MNLPFENVERVSGPVLTGQAEYFLRQQQEIVDRMSRATSDWQLPELPDLSSFSEVKLDLETTGLRWWAGDRLIGVGLWTPDGKTRYLPIRHKVGPNIDEATFFRWVREQLRNKHIVNARTKFDLHMLREDHVDLELQGCTFGDVAHYAALLDDHRTTFNQEDLVRGFLGNDAGKLTQAFGFALNAGKFAEYPPGVVAARAEHDVLMVAALEQAMLPRLEAEDLMRVKAIEDGVIPAVVEMEHNGAPIDVELLNTWCAQVKLDIDAGLYELQRDYGVKFPTPDNRKSAQQLFEKFKLPIPTDPETGAPSYADALLTPIEHPAVQSLRKVKQLASVNAKFLVKYQKSVSRDGILRYELHQLPYEFEKEGHGGGAVSGRFSSAAMTYYDERGKEMSEGANIQQVFGVTSQQKHKPFTKDYIIKRLFIPDRHSNPDAVYVNADASQLQFRLFGHYANNPKIVQAYRENPEADFHDTVGGLVKEYAHKELTRTHTKNVNFAQVFGAGIDKMAEQLGSTREVAEQISEIYHDMFPEVKPLLKLASHLAMPDHNVGNYPCGYHCRQFYRQGYKHRGHVHTYLGRRARFNPGDRFYSAFNRVIQGTEADVIKRIMIEIHKLRHDLGFTPRMTVHDAFVGDLQRKEQEAHFKEVLNTQYYPFNVPILWAVSTGNNWAEAK